MSDKKPPAFDHKDRPRSLAALDAVQVGVSRTAQAIEQTQPTQMHPQLGPLITAPKSDIASMLMQMFVAVEFARDMVEQLAALEKKTGLCAADLTLGRYAGIAVPREAEALVVENNTLFAVVSVESTLMKGHFIPARKELAIADKPTITGEVFTLENLHAAKEQFDAERTKH